MGGSHKTVNPCSDPLECAPSVVENGGNHDRLPACWKTSGNISRRLENRRLGPRSIFSGLPAFQVARLLRSIVAGVKRHRLKRRPLEACEIGLPQVLNLQHVTGLTVKGENRGQ